MRAMRVLSLDWDYFINASAVERSALFPDGGNENLSEPIRNFIWASRYASGHWNGKPLGDISVDKIALAAVRNILKKTVDENTKVVIADSHKYAYAQCVKLISLAEYNALEVYNVDFHHDVYGAPEATNNDVDCGNWMWLTMSIAPSGSKFFWVARADSDIGDSTSTPLVRISGGDIPVGKPFDMVYLCKSSMWSPPHLDSYFANLVKFLSELKAKAFVKVAQDNRATGKRTSPELVAAGHLVKLEAVTDRYTRSMKESIKENKSMLDKCKGGMNHGIIEDSSEP